MVSNVSSVVFSGMCIGCGMCELVCPCNAIRIFYDSTRGTFRPAVSDDDCNSCGACLEICFGSNIGYDAKRGITSTLGPCIEAYSGHAASREMRLKGSSGGLLTAILTSLLENNYIDAAIVANSHNGAPSLTRCEIVRTTEEMKKAQGSKYCPVLISDALRETIDDERYAFVGLPCHIFTLKRLLKSNRIPGEFIAFLGLVCGGAPNYNAIEYLLDCNGQNTSKKATLVYRGNGWPGKLKWKSLESSFEIEYLDYWPQISPWFLSNRCLFCLVGLNPQSDLTFGDAWLPRFMTHNEKGTSIVICRSIRGQKLLNTAAESKSIVTHPLTSKEILDAQHSLLTNRHKHFGTRVSIWKLIGKKPEFTDEMPYTSVPWNWRFFLGELLLLGGRFLARNKDSWHMLRIYRKGIKSIYDSISALRRII